MRPRRRRRPTRHRRVLVVDDSADAADSLALLLALEGHEVSTAYSASAALEAAERLQPDVAFIDIGLPQMDGYEVARRLRASDRCRGHQARGADGLWATRRPRRSAPCRVRPPPRQARGLGSVGAILAELPGRSARSAARAAARRRATYSDFRRPRAAPQARCRATGTVALDGRRGRRELRSP